MRFSDMMGSGTEQLESTDHTDSGNPAENAPAPMAVLEAPEPGPVEMPAPVDIPRPVEMPTAMFAAAAIPPVEVTALADFAPLSDDLLPRRR